MPELTQRHIEFLRVLRNAGFDWLADQMVVDAFGRKLIEDIHSFRREPTEPRGVVQAWNLPQRVQDGDSESLTSEQVADQFIASFRAFILDPLRMNVRSVALLKHLNPDRGDVVIETRWNEALLRFDAVEAERIAADLEALIPFLREWFASEGGL